MPSFYGCFIVTSLWVAWMGRSGNCFTSSVNANKKPVSLQMSSESWSSQDAQVAREELNVWPLDEYNLKLLNEVHPKQWISPLQQEPDTQNLETMEYFDFLAIGAGAGGLVSSRQAARRGAKAAMISAHLAGGDCLNVGCVPSKALIRCARMIREVRKAQLDTSFGVDISGSVIVNFPQIMQRMRKLRATIAPVDGHARGTAIGVTVFQGFGRFVSPNVVEIVPASSEGSVDSKPIRILAGKIGICTGGRAHVPTDIPGLLEAPYITHETLFNLQHLPPRMIILGSGVVALEMAQTFATFGSKVTVLVRGTRLFPKGDEDAGPVMQQVLEECGVTFLTMAQIEKVETLKSASDETSLPLLRVSIKRSDDTGIMTLDCESLLVAAGRIPNLEGMNLEAANIQYDKTEGIVVDDEARSVTNPLVFSVGDCTAGVPRLTHMSGEMAKVVVQNALFRDTWKLSSLVVPQVMYTEPEMATVGVVHLTKDQVDVYTTSLEHNDRAILDGDTTGYIKILCKKGTGTIIGCTIIASRAGEMINEVSLAMKHAITLDGIGRNIHSYPTVGEALMGCGLQYINSKWKRFR
jgi:pyruvate/2-oxoglutarate dehydrogenase complex dihydrolipoamide dehydrogenase (E3) component